MQIMSLYMPGAAMTSILKVKPPPPKQGLSNQNKGHLDYVPLYSNPMLPGTLVTMSSSTLTGYQLRALLKAPQIQRSSLNFVENTPFDKDFRLKF